MISTRKSCTSGISKWCMAGSWITFGILRPLGPVSPDLSGSTGVPFVPRPVPWTDASSNSSSSHINVDSSRAVGEGLGVDHADRVLSMQTTPPLEDLPLPATSEVQWVGAHLAAFVPQRQSLLGNCRASCTLGDSHVGAGVTTSTDSHTHLLQHQEYTPGLANSSEQALVQRGNRASVPSRNQGFLQLSLSWCQRTQGIYVLS